MPRRARRPPLSGSQPEAPDGLTAAAKAATTLLAMLSGRTKASKLREAQDRLLRAGGQLAGVALNDREDSSLRQDMEREL